MSNRKRARITMLIAVATLTTVMAVPSASAQSPVVPVGSLLVDMSSGDSGPQVAALQTMLRSLKMYRGEIDGEYGIETAVAVMTLTKYLRLDRSWSFGAWDWWHIATMDGDHGIPDRPDEPNRVEVDFSRQLLFVVIDGEVEQIAHISGGGNYMYWSERNQRNVRAGTPRGDFHLQRFDNGWGCDDVTGWCVYDYWAFTPYYGIHGYPSVPSYPASHGCVRLNTWEADALQSYFSIGMPVHIWDVKPEIATPALPERRFAYA